jgi:hypothetical protein
MSPGFQISNILKQTYQITKSKKFDKKHHYQVQQNRLCYKQCTIASEAIIFKMTNETWNSTLNQFKQNFILLKSLKQIIKQKKQFTVQ